MTMQSHTDHKIVFRKQNFDFPEDLDRHWLHQSPLQTHIFNTLTLMLPCAERFFCDSIRHYITSLKDPKLVKDARSFISQEIQHYNGHTLSVDIMKKQGYKLDGYLSFVRRYGFYSITKIFGPKVALAATAGYEHYTTSLAELLLQSTILDDAEPHMKELFEWHAAEEIEHKSVAIDVLKAVDSGYWLRILGYILGTGSLFFFSTIGLLMLLKQDKALFRWRNISDYWYILKQGKFFIPSLFQALKYFKPNYHPSELNTDYLAENVLGRFPPAPIARP